MCIRTRVIVYTLLSLICCGSCYGKSTSYLSDREIDAALFALKPLPKVHYSCPVPHDVSPRRLYELVRITHSISVKGQWVKSDHIDRCVYTCAKVNKTSPTIKASISVNFSPWHERLGKGLPPTYRGKSYYEEISFFEARCKLVKQWIKQSNKKYRSNVEVTALTLDCERFHERAGDKSWNDGMREALDAIHKKARSIFPDARIEWYGRGVSVVSGSDGWTKLRYWTGKEIKAPLSCSLYTVPEIERTRETFRRTAKLADEMGISDVTPYVALASGYRRGLKGLSDQKFDHDWSYDIIYSYLLGRELNVKWYGDRPKRFAPYNRAKVIVFYPPAFDRRSPDWARHFIAYVRGATRVTMLKDLGYERE